MRGIWSQLVLGVSVLAAGLPAAAAADSRPAAEWEFQFLKNLIWIDVKVGGSRPLRFILDSASTHHVISSAAAQQLDLPESDETLLVRQTDSIKEHTMTRPVDLRIAGFTIKKVPLLVLPLGEIDGILGLPLFEQFLVQVDYGNSKIRLFAKSSASSFEGAQELPLQTADGLMGIRLMDRADTRGLFVLDTGCSRTLIVSQHASRKFGFCKAIPTGAQVLYAGGDIQTVRFSRTTWQIGTRSVHNVEALVSTELADGLLADPKWTGIVGNGLLSKFTVTFDLPRGRIFLEPAREISRFGDKSL